MEDSQEDRGFGVNESNSSIGMDGDSACGLEGPWSLEEHAKRFGGVLASHGIKYSEMEERVYHCSFESDYRGTIAAVVLFRSDNAVVSVISPNVIGVPSERVGAMLTLLNKLSFTYVFAKFIIDDDGKVLVKADIDCSCERPTLCEETLLMLMRVVEITDDAFPVLAKTAFSESPQEQAGCPCVETGAGLVGQAENDRGGVNE